MQRQARKIFAVLKHEIEGAVEELCFTAQRILQELEMRNAVLVERDKLAVDDGIALDAFERLCDLDVVVADDLAVAAVERDLAAFDLCDHAEAIVFVLENPAVIVERPIGQRGKHRLEPLRQSGDAAH